jgi:hypothetical protein
VSIVNFGMVIATKKILNRTHQALLPCLLVIRCSIAFALSLKFTRLIDCNLLYMTRLIHWDISITVVFESKNGSDNNNV